MNLGVPEILLILAGLAVVALLVGGIVFVVKLWRR
jgi:hypothetical protein